MTALAGFWSFNGRDCASAVRRMLKSQEIYGHHSAHWSGGDISLGRHLFKIPPEDTRDLRPQVGGDGTLILVADVRLDNREELATDLGLSPSLLRSMPDSAVLMRALEAWGESAVNRLVGDFAFALWNSRAQYLLLARDFLGQRPLHFHRNRHFFALASMPKGLHALPEVPVAPDADTVANFIALLPETRTASFYRHIERVEPGHLVRVTRNGISSRSYWTAPREVLMLKDDREYEEAVRVEMDRAVASRLRGVTRLGAHLSAGLDSSTVAATAARHLTGRGSVIAYTAAPREGYTDGIPHAITDEFPLAAQVAALYDNIEHVRIPSSGSSPVARLDHYFFIFDRPILNLCNMVWSSGILDDAKARGLRVLLGGETGNLSFSYDGMTALPQMVRDRQWGRLARTAGSLVGSGTRAGTIAAQIIGPFLPTPIWRAILKIRGKVRRLTISTLINPKLEPVLTKMAAQHGLDFSYAPRSDLGTRIRSLQHFDSGNYNKGCLGGWGVDLRDPTADQRLVELCLSIPAERFLAGGVPRSLARRAFSDRLPAAVCNERRKGYQAADWHEALTRARSSITEEIERCATIPMVAELFSTKRMYALVREWPKTNWNEDETIQSHRLALLRGTSAAHFVRRASGSNS